MRRSPGGSAALLQRWWRGAIGRRSALAVAAGRKLPVPKAWRAAWIREAPDGSWVQADAGGDFIAAGFYKDSSPGSVFQRYLVRLDHLTGKLVWAVKFNTTASEDNGTHATFESIGLDLKEGRQKHAQSSFGKTLS